MYILGNFIGTVEWRKVGEFLPYLKDPPGGSWWYLEGSSIISEWAFYVSLFFADDILFFGEASAAQSEIIETILDELC